MADGHGCGEVGLLVPRGRVRHLEHRLPAVAGEPEQRCDPADVVRAEDGVDVRRPLEEQLAVLLGQAAADRDLQLGPSLLDRLQMPEVPVELVVGVLADAAGVEDDNVGLVQVLGAGHAVCGQHRGDALGVVFVHLAPERANQESPNLGHRPRLGDRPAAENAARRALLGRLGERLR